VADPRFYSAAGNRFAVLDAFEREPAEPAALARELCARHGVDGLLLGARPLAGGDCRMLVYNKDGSRAEACGNGLRALARWAVESEHARDTLVIETDSGPRRVTCLRRAREIVAARAELGVPRLVERETELAVEGRTLRATLVDMGNPHCVLFVRDVGRAEVALLGSALERHARFPQRTNVSFVELAGGRLLVRTWERGVGETAACGTGIGASAVAALVHGFVRSPVEVGARGGRLQVDWDGTGVLTLAGPVEALRV
jgi:diaminopimelate epimerase